MSLGLYVAVKHAFVVVSSELYQGRVVDFTYKESMVGSIRKYTKYPIVEFVDAAGQHIKAISINMEFFFKRYKTGDTVGLYIAKDTNELIINDFYSLWSQALMALT